MANDHRSPRDALIGRFEAEPYRFGFYQALRRLEALHADSPGLGRSRRASQDPIRLGQAATLSFAPSTLAEMQPAADQRPERLLQYFHGLFGPNGPLPIHLTEFAMERRLSYHDETFERFCDIFHHRLVSLFYRIRANAEPALCEDRPDQNRFRTYVGALFGTGMPSLRGQDECREESRLFHAGHFGDQKRSPGALLGIVAQQFSMPIRMHEFEPEWLELPNESRLHLGHGRTTGRLGINTVIGARTWERQFRFALEFGPVSRAQFESLLPDQPSPARLAALVRSFVGLEFSWEYRVSVRADEVPTTCLGRYGQLGWSTWLAGCQRAPETPDFFHEPGIDARPMEALHG
ncbi:MAG: type VI secretion system baseplate subunit TssG [Gammaproteobacteria bacterium HGW-Gammaproteobacteria-8]|nr:MAG: type VI secretion system baseplate subunit TssG [Gammaproteobacteria bacterium HGW-Gammaproteobacteria-8]